MTTIFYIAGAVAITCTVMTITARHVIHALLYMIVSLLAIAIDFYAIGASFVAALEVIIYAGAIMVLFVFVVMMLNVGADATATERGWLRPGIWLGPAALASVLFIEVAFLLTQPGNAPVGGSVITSKQVAVALYGPYMIGVELASLLLMAGLVGAYHLGRRLAIREEVVRDINTYGSRVAAGDSAVSVGTDRSSHAA
jgi:NADH-quinone oxidoreductase subunit J